MTLHDMVSGKAFRVNLLRVGVSAVACGGSLIVHANGYVWVQEEAGTIGREIRNAVDGRGARKAAA